MRAFLSLCALLVAVTSLIAADNWPQFRGPNGDGLAISKTAPTKWSETEGVRWKTAIHDKGWSSPVVWGDQVWVTTAKENGTELFAVCLDRKSGSVVHDLKLFSPAKPPDIKQFNSHATPTPVLEEGRVYAHFGSYGTACLDSATGKVLWQRTDFECDHYRGPASSPVVYKQWLFVQFDGFDKQFVACLDKDTGATVWQKPRDLPYPNNGDLKKGFATPAILHVNGKPQLVSSAAIGTIAYDPATGDELWRIITGGMNEACRPILAHGLIYLTTGHTQNILAVKAGGTGDITKDGVAWKFSKEAPTKPSPIVVDDLLFFINDKGVAGCLDAKTGKLHWQERLNETCAASPVFAGGNIYFTGDKGKVFVVAADKTFKLVETNTLDSGCMASPAIVGGELFLRTKTHLYCIGAK